MCTTLKWPADSNENTTTLTLQIPMEVTITNSTKEKLDYAFHGDPTDTSLLVIIGHGVTGNKDRPWAVGLADAIADAGFAALRFSYSGNGDSEGDFAKSTITKEIKDLKAIVNAAEDAGYHKICYAGHSMGAAVGVLAASRDDRIEMLISLAGMVDTARFCKAEFGDVTPGKGNMWDEEGCPLSQEFVDDMMKIKNVSNKTEKIEASWLIVHGDKDDLVPVEEGREIYAKCYEPKHYVEIAGGDHVFSGKSLKPMTKAVVEWLEEQQI
ncbi:MAG: alpha/beta fold hydrolase [Verrucomicrobiales bacterium]|nr:alpha/beta fold hydrolase [Verrucomicrobiales bacterium]